MTTRGTHKFEFTGGLGATSEDTKTRPGLCGTPQSGFAIVFVVGMVALLIFGVLHHLLN